jgi:Dynamin central region
VLTKPDRIPSGEAENWLAFIRGEKEPLANGWYAVKQPGSQALERGITWAEAREEEDRFFATESEWCDLDSIYHRYLRTSNLVARLSEILSDLISKRLVFISSTMIVIIQIMQYDACLLNRPLQTSRNPR